MVLPLSPFFASKRTILNFEPSLFEIIPARLIPFLAVAFSFALLFYVSPTILFLVLPLMGEGVTFYMLNRRFKTKAKVKSRLPRPHVLPNL